MAAYADKALIAKVDVRDNPALARRYSIARLPGLVFVKDGATVAQTSGALPETTLRAWLEHLVAGGPRPALPEGRVCRSMARQSRARRRVGRLDHVPPIREAPAPTLRPARRS